MFLRFLVFCCWLWLSNAAWAQVGLPLGADGSVDYARCFPTQKRAQIVFVLDVSGSMWKQNLPLTKGRILRIFEAAESRAGVGNVEWGILAVYAPGRTAFFPTKPKFADKPDDKTALAPFGRGRQGLQSTLAQIDLFGVWGFELVEQFCDLAVQNYAWNPGLARHIWIMGNGSFQGTGYAASAARAFAGGFRVHTFYCSSLRSSDLAQNPLVYQRQLMAAAGGGTFSCLSVLPDEGSSLAAQILALNASWNQTLVPMGVPGLNAWRELLRSEEQARSVGEVTFLGFVMRKIAQPLPFDLVSLSQNGQIPGDLNALPAGWAQLSPAQRLVELQNLARARRALALQLRLLILGRGQSLELEANAERQRAMQMDSDLRRARLEALRNPGVTPVAGAMWPATGPFGKAPTGPTSARAEAPQITDAEFDVARLSDDFADAQTKTYWKGDAQKWNIEPTQGVAILENGAQISKTLDGDWSATVRLEDISSRTAAFRFFARTQRANLEFSFSPRSLNWRLLSGPTIREGEGKSLVSPRGRLALRLEKRGDELTISQQKGEGLERSSWEPLSGTVLESLAKNQTARFAVGLQVESESERQNQAQNQAQSEAVRVDSITFARLKP